MWLYTTTKACQKQVFTTSGNQSLQDRHYLTEALYGVLRIKDKKYSSVTQVPKLTSFFFETFLFILDYILRPRSVLPPGPVKDLYPVYMGIHLHSVFNIL